MSNNLLNFVSANVQKSAMNTSILLEAHSEADVIFAQEIYWGHIKSVASTKVKEGDSYQNAVSHP